jgi:catechol 2,3-dioxygenase-like lactoylglutathione lyase family enzyme
LRFRVTAIRKLARFSLTTGEADRLGVFYERALGFRRLGVEDHSGAQFEALMGIAGGARALVLSLGEQVVELLEFASPGRPYPPDAASSDIAFQHFAIVVAHMDAAYQRLHAVAGWRAITSGGPQRLPETSGGVTAFKFRDLEGHPLELLAFPEGKAPPYWRARRGDDPCLGIDHSAISVSDVARSVAFYEQLGLAVSARSHNHGPEQAWLDGMPSPDIEVTALEAREATPHIELLGYRGVARGAAVRLANNDIAATRLTLEAGGKDGALARRSVFDPDGHHLVIDAPADG